MSMRWSCVGSPTGGLPVLPPPSMLLPSPCCRTCICSCSCGLWQFVRKLLPVCLTAAHGQLRAAQLLAAVAGKLLPLIPSAAHTQTDTVPVAVPRNLWRCIRCRCFLLLFVGVLLVLLLLRLLPQAVCVGVEQAAVQPAQRAPSPEGWLPAGGHTLRQDRQPHHEQQGTHRTAQHSTAQDALTVHVGRCWAMCKLSWNVVR
jgi:hypothetical protein